MLFLFSAHHQFLMQYQQLFLKNYLKKIIIWVLDLWPDTVVDLKLVNNNF